MTPSALVYPNGLAHPLLVVSVSQDVARCVQVTTSEAREWEMPIACLASEPRHYHFNGFEPGSVVRPADESASALMMSEAVILEVVSPGVVKCLFELGTGTTYQTVCVPVGALQRAPSPDERRASSQRVIDAMRRDSNSAPHWNSLFKP